MDGTDWSDTIVIIVSGIAVLSLSIIMIVLGYTYELSMAFSIIAPLTALFLGVIGLRIYGIKSEARDDRLHALSLWFSIGLIMFCLAEITETLVRITQNTQQMVLTVLLIQIPGILLWGFGILQYLSSLNKAFRFSESGILWIWMGIISGVTSIGLVMIVTFQFPEQYLIENIIISPMIVGLTIFTLVACGLVWIFREGLLSKPLIFILSSFSLLALRFILWLLIGFQFDSFVDGMISTEAYLLCGGALMQAKNLEDLGE